MKKIRIIVVGGVLIGSMMAQAGGPKPPQTGVPAAAAATSPSPNAHTAAADAKPGAPSTAKASTRKPASPMEKKAKNPMKVKRAAKAARSSSTVEKPLKPAKMKSTAAATPSSTEEAPAPAAPARNTSNIGKRDPFISPVMSVQARAGTGGVCTSGKRCLMVDQLTLKGIVKTGEKWIALVENPAKRDFFLSENDALFDGTVKKINIDTVTFSEVTTDRLGKLSTRDVVKKVSVPAV